MKTETSISLNSNTTISTTTNNLTTTIMKTQVTNNRLRFAIRKAVLTLVAAVAVAATQVTFGATGPEPAAAGSLQSTVFQLPNSLKFKTIIAANNNNKVFITILNAKNETIYTEVTKNNSSYIRTFDFSTLADGEYTFQISNGKETQSKTFKIETTTARVVNLN
ncbi:hypothetical protein QNI19_28425 [Cytophagaceae bacterium DM2B3-1]|uniref:Secretion system C-terminal sorting domain-containing protein n=2 Tax=Xanthocytophaga flava TaxID=3048013 RepID=A0ABT7CVD7_9BACT|nr:hypothetical protein [Xanthocytophaga flavus]MDJ1471958.1 hypothetical protein [Xanthocytophaga flavus]MDJ1496895.1 hypothetical protein [Xanthocytophaga flavus]